MLLEEIKMKLPYLERSLQNVLIKKTKASTKIHKTEILTLFDTN
jgi:hypothetical protein